MPYDEERDEFFWGKCFSRDESDYDHSFPRPRMSDAVKVLKTHFSGNTTFSVAVCGKMYKGRSKISGASSNVDLDSISIVAGTPGRSLEWKIMRLFGLLEEPEHITGIFFRALD